MTRIFTLDYLRGLAALSILIYHFYAWQGFNLDANSFLGRIGLYGVTIFYILSGLTLYHVYKNQVIDNRFSLKNFYIKRFARIYPLLIATTIVSIILYRYSYSNIDLFLNITGLFGFIKWDTYYATGAWSIGNELTFYALFPILILSIFRNRTLFYFLSLAILAISLYYSFIQLPPQIEGFWRDYINPLNQAIYFTSGVIFGNVLNLIKFKQFTLWMILFLSILIFTYWPTTDQKIQLISGLDRYILFICCILVVGCTTLIKPFTLELLNKPLVFLGEISYSLYLIHPLVYKFMGILDDKYNYTDNRTVFLMSIIMVTIFVSWLSYSFFEKPAMKMINTIFQRAKLSPN